MNTWNNFLINKHLEATFGKQRILLRAFLAIPFLLFANFAVAGPTTLTYQGRITNAVNQPLEYNNVAFIFQVISPSGLCVIYQEQVNGIDMTNSGGVFDVPIGNGSVTYPTGGGFTVTQAFDNSLPIVCKGGSTYNPAANDGRYLRVQFYDGVGWRTITPDSVIRSVPYASYSDVASKLEDKVVNDFVLKTGIPSCGSGSFLGWDGTSLTCNAPGAFTGTLSGDVSGSQTSTSVDKIKGRNVDLTGITAGQFLRYDGSKFVAGSGNVGTVTGVSAAPGKPISVTNGTSSAVIDITQANSSTDGYLTAGDWTVFNAKLGSITNNAPLSNGNIWIGDASNKAQSYPVTGDMTLSSNGVATLKNTGTAGTYKSVTTDAQGRVTSGTNPTTLLGFGITDAVQNVTGTPGVATGADATKGSAGVAGLIYVASDTKKIYRDNGLTWDIIGTTNASDITAGTLPAAQLPVVPTTRGGTGLSAVGTSNQVLGMNNAASGMEYKSITAGTGVTINHSANTITINASGTGGTVTSITAGTGLTGGTITTSGTIGLGTELTGVNSLSTTGFVKRTGAGAYSTSASVGLTTDVSGILPIANGGTGASTAITAINNLLPSQGLNSGKVLQTDGTNVSWITPNAGSVTNVTGTAPISVATGTTTPAISISQATTSTNGYLSSTDWNTFNNKLGTSSTFSGDVSGTSSTTSVDKIKGRTVATTTPTSGQVLTWNNTLSQWEPVSPSAAGITALTGDVAATGPGSAAATIATGAVNSAKIADGSVGVVDLDFAGAMATNTGLVVRNGSQFFNKTCSGNEALIWTVSNGWSCSAIVLGATNFAGDVTGPASATVVEKIRGVNVNATAPTTGQILIYDSGTTSYRPQSLSGAITTTSAGVTSYNGTVPVNKGGTNLTSLGTANQVLGVNSGASGMEYKTITAGSGVTISHAANAITINATGTGGTVTDITAGTGLTGGTITGSGTIGLGTELTGLNGLATTGFMKRTGAGAYSTSSSISLTSDISGTLPIANGGTGATTATAALTNLLPTQTGQSGKVLSTNGTAASWVTNTNGTVTNVTGTAPISVATGTTTPAISISQATGSTDGYLSSTDWTTFNSKLGNSLTNGSIWVGNASNVPTAAAPSGDVSMTNAGVFTVNKIHGDTISATTPTDSQFLIYDSTTTSYRPYAMSGAITMTDTGVTSYSGTVPVNKGGTALTALGTANQVLGVNNGATGMEYKTITAGSGVTISHAANAITINATGSGGTVTSITAGTGLTGGTITGSGTIGLGTELTGVNGLSTTGFVKRTGAGAYSTSASINLASDITGTLPIANGGTGQTTATAALTALLPTQTGNSGKVLSTNGTAASWVTNTSGTVTSVGVAVPSYMSSSGGPVTSSGTITLGFGSQSAREVFAAPSGAAGAPDFRLLRITDIRGLSAGDPAFWNISGACPAGQIPTHFSATDQVSCSAMTLTSSQVTTALGYTPANGTNYIAKAGDTGVGSLDFTNGSNVRFGHANQSDGNDGKIGAGLFSAGLNIVGTQTVAAAGRKITMYGDTTLNGGLNTTGSVGIGTTAGGSTLTVATGSGQFTNGIFVGASTHATSRRASLSLDDWAIVQDTNGNGTKDFSIYQGSAAASRIVIGTTGNVGIGSTASGYKLDVAGSLNATSIYLNGTALNASSTIPASVATSANSLVRRDGSGYIFNNYFNMTADVQTTTPQYFVGEWGGDNFLRYVAPANVTVGKATLADTVRGVGSGNMTFNWNGQSGQPSWLWGSNDGTNLYVWNPSNFNVAYATNAGTAANATNATNAGTAAALASTADNVSTSGWYRSNGNVGWFNNTHGGGIWMQDASWIRTYGNKNFYVQGANLAVDGNAGIGTTSPSEKLEVSGNVKATAFISTSDRRLKTNIRTSEGLSKVTQLRGVRFNWKSDGVAEYGTIAQEVEQVFPELVITDKKTGFKAVKYQALIGPLIEATKELNNKCDMSAEQTSRLQAGLEQAQQDIQTIKRRLASVEGENTELKSILKSMSDRLKALEDKTLQQEQK